MVRPGTQAVVTTHVLPDRSVPPPGEHHALRLTPPSAAEYNGRLLMFAQWLTEVDELSRVTELLAPRVGDLPAAGAQS